MAYIKVAAELCKGCALCTAACPMGIIALGDEINGKGYTYAAQTNADKCTGCTLCALVCPDAAIEVYR